MSSAGTPVAPDGWPGCSAPLAAFTTLTLRLERIAATSLTTSAALAVTPAPLARFAASLIAFGTTGRVTFEISADIVKSSVEGFKGFRLL